MLSQIENNVQIFYTESDTKQIIVNVMPTKKPFSKFAMVYGDFIFRHGTLSNTNRVARDTFMYLVKHCVYDKELKLWNPFYKIKQKDLAVLLNTQPKTLWTGLQVLKESKLVIQVTPSIFMINIKYYAEFKASYRSKLLTFLDNKEEKYLELYELYQTGKVLDILG